MTAELDAGDILGQSDLSLLGTMDQIFKRIEDAGVELTRHILDNGLKREPQDHSRATYCKSTPSESEITAEELATKPAEYLYNKIVCCQALIRLHILSRLMVKVDDYRSACREKCLD